MDEAALHWVETTLSAATHAHWTRRIDHIKPLVKAQRVLRGLADEILVAEMFGADDPIGRERVLRLTRRLLAAFRLLHYLPFDDAGSAVKVPVYGGAN